MRTDAKAVFADIYCSTEGGATRHERYPGRYICTECGAECRKDGFRLDKRTLPPERRSTTPVHTGRRGRPATVTDEQRARVTEMRGDGRTFREIASALGINEWVAQYIVKNIKEAA